MDWTNIIVAVLALLGTLGGSYGGIRASNRVVELRLAELEKKVEKHNNLVERMARVEIRLEEQERETNQIAKVWRYEHGAADN